MKIAEISAVFPPYRGGIGSVCRQNARMLSQKGHTVTVLTPWYRRMCNIVSEYSKEEGYTVHRLKPLVEWGNAAVIPHLRNVLKEMDVVHLHVPFIGISIGSLGLRPDQKLIVTYHMDLIGRDWKATFFEYYTKHILPPIIKRADTIFFSSMDYGTHSNIASMIQERPSVFMALPNSVDSVRYLPKPVNEDLRKQNSLVATDKVILYVGGLDSAHYFKGIEYLINAFEIMMRTVSVSCKLVIVGDGDLRPHYEALAQQKGLSDRIIFPGNPSDDVVCDYYNVCDVFVLPSIDSSEAFGMVLVEAMACGKPVITTNLPGPRSVVRDGINGYVVAPRNAEDLARKISMIVMNDTLAMDMGKKGKELVDSLYSYEVVSKQLSDIVARI